MTKRFRYKGTLPEISLLQGYCPRKALRPAAHHFSASYILQRTASQHDPDNSRACRAKALHCNFVNKHFSGFFFLNDESTFF